MFKSLVLRRLERHASSYIDVGFRDGLAKNIRYVNTRIARLECECPNLGLDLLRNIEDD